MRRLIVISMTALLMVGCATEEAAEVLGNDSAQLTQSEAYQALVGTNPVGNTFVSSPTLACGHFLTLGKGTTPNTGRYEYTFIDCDLKDRIRSRGTFKVVGGLFGGALTDPTLEITPNPNQPDTEGWSYKIRTAKESDGLPVGTVFLESTSSHHARLRPQGLGS